jgi:hypothetical protein
VLFDWGCRFGVFGFTKKQLFFVFRPILYSQNNGMTCQNNRKGAMVFSNVGFITPQTKTLCQRNGIFDYFNGITCMLKKPIVISDNFAQEFKKRFYYDNCLLYKPEREFNHCLLDYKYHIYSNVI